ncbi:hypothetical protein PHLH8_22950 [Pseudomonas sp. Pc102]|uniref:hypothetical protein n=1 Tax=Pseudomonas sp. Pc102 TaxID=2678261 RepID=UPI001BCC796E|nr:hypothetical protein [Pseudomonas sp. Pc102]BBP82653.1 hypothetical protein PHLH8_22950 [Pseudomonas sp. Pc102]
MNKGLPCLSLLGLALLGGCVPPPSLIDQQRQYEQDVEAQARQLHAATDDLFEAAMASGMAIVVTTTVNLDSQQYNFENNDDSVRFEKLRTGTAVWRNSANPQRILYVGNNMKAEKIGVHGSHYQTVFGRTLYQIYIVEPGHYDLVGSLYNSPRTTTPNPQANRDIAPSPLGKVTLVEKEFSEFDRGQRWQDPQYQTDTVNQNYCAAVRVVSGECVSWGTSSYDVTRQTSAGGWVADINERKVASVEAHSELKKAFASFDVAPGEAIVVDGFYPEAPNVGFEEKDCRRVANDKLDCELSALYMVRIPTGLQEFRGASDPSKYGYMKMSKALANLQYRPVKLNAKPVKDESIWGETYVLKR